MTTRDGEREISLLGTTSRVTGAPRPPSPVDGKGAAFPPEFYRGRNFGAFGDVPEGTRFRVGIDDQPANPWSRRPR